MLNLDVFAMSIAFRKIQIVYVDNSSKYLCHTVTLL